MTPLPDIKSLLAGITQGKWPNWNDPNIRRQLWHYYDILKTRDDRAPICLDDSDAAFIAAAPQLVSELVVRVESVEAICQKLIAHWKIVVGPNQMASVSGTSFLIEQLEKELEKRK